MVLSSEGKQIPTGLPVSSILSCGAASPGWFRWAVGQAEPSVGRQRPRVAERSSAAANVPGLSPRTTSPHQPTHLPALQGGAPLTPPTETILPTLAVEAPNTHSSRNSPSLLPPQTLLLLTPKTGILWCPVWAEHCAGDFIDMFKTSSSLSWKKNITISVLQWWTLKLRGHSAMEQQN